MNATTLWSTSTFTQATCEDVHSLTCYKLINSSVTLVQSAHLPVLRQTLAENAYVSRKLADI